MRIAIDLDDTLSEFCDSWIGLYNEIYDDNVKPSEVMGWDIENYCKKCTKQELYDLLGIKNFFYEVKPIPYAKTVIDKLKKYGHEVFIVTAYYPSSVIDKVRWLSEYVGISHEDIIFCNKKHLIYADYLIDDGAHNHANFCGKSVVYDRPHNQHMREFEYDIRVRDWKEIEIYFKNIENII